MPVYFVAAGLHKKSVSQGYKSHRYCHLTCFPTAKDGLKPSLTTRYFLFSRSSSMQIISGTVHRSDSLHFFPVHSLSPLAAWPRSPPLQKNTGCRVSQISHLSFSHTRTLILFYSTGIVLLVIDQRMTQRPDSFFSWPPGCGLSRLPVPALGIRLKECEVTDHYGILTWLQGP